jgi:hypothetical protein
MMRNVFQLALEQPDESLPRKQAFSHHIISIRCSCTGASRQVADTNAVLPIFVMPAVLAFLWQTNNRIAFESGGLSVLLCYQKKIHFDHNIFLPFILYGRQTL